MSLKVKMVTVTPLTSDEELLLQALKPKLSASTQFILHAEQNDMFSRIKDMDVLTLIHNRTTSAKTVRIDTDGTQEFSDPINFADGSTQRVVVRGWNYVIIENELLRQGGLSKVVTTCYLKNQKLYGAIRRAFNLA